MEVSMAQKTKITRPKKRRKWSADVMKRSDALDLEQGVFTKSNPRQIAASLKRSALRSTRRKGTPFQSAMSMLNFHINRGGKKLSAKQKTQLQRAKGELRKLFGKPDVKK
jgi:hypothetical protein